MLVRTWNVFHGNTVPVRRETRIAEAIRRVTEDGPDVVCLQELPVWSLPLLDDWSAMTALGEVAQPPRIGPLPSTADIGRRLTSLNHGLLRSAFSGQATAILVAPSLRVVDSAAVVLNPRWFRREQAELLRLGLVTRLAWARERRVCQAVRVELGSGGSVTIANVHTTWHRPDERVADAELLRAAVFLDAFAKPDDVCVLAGDFNIRAGRSWTLEELGAWGFSSAGEGIDHVLVRGAEARQAERWPDDRRRADGLLLSDHAPVEVTLDVR